VQLATPWYEATDISQSSKLTGFGVPVKALQKCVGLRLFSSTQTTWLRALLWCNPPTIHEGHHPDSLAVKKRRSIDSLLGGKLVSRLAIFKYPVVGHPMTALGMG
jgi:hypothetical protein